MARSMTDDEIRISYRDSRDKVKQVAILSQLNCCSKDSICDIIGIRVLQDVKMIEAKLRDDRLNQRNSKFLELYNEGLVDSDIAKYTNVKRSVVSHWRSDNGIPSQGKRRKFGKQ